MPATGNLLAESLRKEAPLAGVPFTVTSIQRLDVGDTSVGQPLTWTFIAFEVPDEEAENLASALSGVLDDALGWYCDFRSGTDTFVVFAGRIFRYRRGDRDGRAEAEEYARAVGVPEAQIDWRE